MKKILKICFSLFIVILLGCGAAVAETVSFTDEKNGDVLSINGNIASGEGIWVSAEVINPDGEVVYRNSKKSDTDGKFSFGFLFTGEDEPGEYKISVRGSGATDEKSEKIYEYYPSGDSAFSSFKIDGSECKIENDRISLTLPSGTDRNGLIAEFKTDSRAVVTVNDKIQESGVTRNNFTKEVVYKVTAEDKTYTEYKVNISVKKESSISSGGGGRSSGSAGISVGMPQKNEVREALEPEPEPDVSAAPEATGEYFLDVPKDYWAAGYIEYLFEEGIISGTDEESFLPEESVTREEFVKMMCEVLDIETYEPEEAVFNDVPLTEWYAPYIDALVSEELIKGISDEKFGVGEKILRCDMAVLIKRCCDYLSIEQSAPKKTFEDDSEIADYAKDAVYAMLGIGVINGNEDNMFKPNDTATRAEAAKIIYVMINKM